MSGAHTSTLVDESNVPCEVHADASETPGAPLCFAFLCLFTVAVYGRPEDIFPAIGALHLTLALGICAAVAFLGALVFGDARLHRSRELPYLFWLTVLFAAGIPFAIWRGGSFNVFTQTWLKTFLIFALLTQTLVTIVRIRAVLWAIVLSELVVCAYSILHPDQSAWVGDRMSGVNQGILGWNFLGIAAALTIPYIAVLFVDRPSVPKTVVLAAATAAVLWMVVLTASRSGVLVLAFSIVMTWFMVLRGTPRGKGIGALLVIVLVVACCAAPGVLWQRMQTMWSDASPASSDAASAEMSGDERRMALQRSVRYTIEHPLFGLGLGNFSVESGTEPGQPSSWLGTHNSFTELSSEAGIPALLVFAALLVTTLKSMHRIGSGGSESPENDEVARIARATFVSVLSFVVGAFFAHIAYEYFLYYPIAVAAGVEYLVSQSPTGVAEGSLDSMEVEAA
jgi:O-antigen ligase